MLSPADMVIIGAFALIVFGPDQLPKVARRAGQVVREVQNTSQSFIREMERAADDIEFKERAAAAGTAPVAEHVARPDAAAAAIVPAAERAAEPAAAEPVDERPADARPSES